MISSLLSGMVGLRRRTDALDNDGARQGLRRSMLWLRRATFVSLLQVELSGSLWKTKRKMPTPVVEAVQEDEGDTVMPDVAAAPPVQAPPERGTSSPATANSRMRPRFLWAHLSCSRALPRVRT